MTEMKAFFASETALANAVLPAFLRLSDEDKEAVVAVALNVRVPEIRAALFVAAWHSNLNVPEVHEEEAAQVLDRAGEADEKRTSRGQAIAAGHRRRREAKVDLKAVSEVDHRDETAVSTRGSAPAASLAEMGPDRTPDGLSVLTRPSMSSVHDQRVDRVTSPVAVQRAGPTMPAAPAASTAPTRSPFVPAAPSTHPASGSRPASTLSPATPTPTSPRGEEDRRG